MTYEEMIDKVYRYYQDNESDFNNDVESLDDWNGFLEDDRVYDMYMLDEIYFDMRVSEFIDKLSGVFDKNDKFFKHDQYGISTLDKKDYSDYLEKSTVEHIYDNRSHLFLTDEVNEIFNEYDKQEDEEDD